MKTKFSELLKVRKQKVSEIERKLASVQAQKAQTRVEIAELDSALCSLEIPQNGDAVVMHSFLAQKEFLYRDKLQKENILKYFEQEISNLNILYKEASTEYEKIKYMHTVEIEKLLEMRKKEESKQLDEIATQLFIRNQKKGSS